MNSLFLYLRKVLKLMNKKRSEQKFYWHTHHDVLVDVEIVPIEKRIKYIKENKLKDEIELRLKLLRPVKGELPKEVVSAGKDCKKTWEDYDDKKKAWGDYLKAKRNYLEVLRDYKEEINALHKEECPDCPWDGRSIFPNRKG